MNEFLEIALSFPTVVFSGMLVCVLLYWLMAIAGAVDLDIFDVDFDLDGDFDLSPDVDFEMDVAADADADVDVDVDVDGDIETSQGGLLHALMAAIGLGRVPVTIIGSILTLVAWFLCFAAVHYLGPIIGTGVVVGLGVIVGSLVASLPITSMITHPLKGIFEVHTKSGGQSLVGKLCKVTSGRVSASFGQATVDDGGAGLLVSIRCETEGALERGAQALIIDYDDDSDVYFVEPYDHLISDGDAAYDDEVVLDEHAAAVEAEQTTEEPAVK